MSASNRPASYEQKGKVRRLLAHTLITHEERQEWAPLVKTLSSAGADEAARQYQALITTRTPTP